MKAGIIIDSWKLGIFERHLKQGGYTWEQLPGIVPKTISLFVQSENMRALGVVVQAANDEAALTGDQDVR